MRNGRGQFIKGNKEGFGQGNQLWKQRKRWTGEGGVDSLGYHRKSEEKYNRVRTHRLVMEKMLGRKLLRTEHVHHKNNNKLDNRPENLELVSASDHAKIHYKSRKLDKYGRLQKNS